MSKFVVFDALFGEKFAINPDKIETISLVTDEHRQRLIDSQGEAWSAINTIIQTENRSTFTTDTFDEVVSKINAVQEH